MKVRFVGKFFDNHSLSIVNRNIVKNLAELCDISVVPIDTPVYNSAVSTEDIEYIVSKTVSYGVPNIEIRHSYPPMWDWPESDKTKVVYIQPWEFPNAVPSEWQFKFSTFSDHLIVPSKFTYDSFISAGIDPLRMSVIANGYNPKIFTQHPKNSNEVVILYVGNSQYRKGLDILLSAWAEQTNSSMPIRLIIKDNPRVYGSSSILDDIIKLQYQSKCAKIEYIDSDLSEAEMANLYKAAHILVHPHRGEGFGLHVLEGMMCGAIPVVTGNSACDDFVVDFLIPASLKMVNMYEIFAIKATDSLSSMGAHKFIYEPDYQAFKKIFAFVISNSISLPVDTSKAKTWSQIAKEYYDVLNTVDGKKVKRLL